jgi:hypothetical protein
MESYVLGSKEFVPVTIALSGVPLTDASAVTIAVVPCPPSRPIPDATGASYAAAAQSGQLVGFYTDTITTPGVYAIFAKVVASPQLPILLAGQLEIW